MSNLIDYNRRTLVVVTGASQGIGQSICVEVSRLLSNDSIIFLIARSQDGLNRTKNKIHEINNKLTVKTFSIDLSAADLKSYENIFDDFTMNVENAIIFHNAGSLGTLDKVSMYTDLNVWTQFFHLNLFSVSLLNSVFLQTMRKLSKHLYVVNISSLCGSQAFSNMGMYGSGKAARNLFFKALAVEETDVVVINYSPGPVDTDMVTNVVENIKDAEMKARFSEMKEKKTILKADVTVNKLLTILQTGEFKSGDLVDYFDRI